MPNVPEWNGVQQHQHPVRVGGGPAGPSELRPRGFRKVLKSWVVAGVLNVQHAFQHVRIHKVGVGGLGALCIAGQAPRLFLEMHDDLARHRGGGRVRVKSFRTTVGDAVQGVLKRLDGHVHAANFLVKAKNAQVFLRQDKGQNLSRTLQIRSGLGKSL